MPVELTWLVVVKAVVEADGVYGHLGKRDRKRDSDLLDLEDIDYVIHIKEKTNEKIKEQLWFELNNFCITDNSHMIYKLLHLSHPY